MSTLDTSITQINNMKELGLNPSKDYTEHKLNSIFMDTFPYGSLAISTKADFCSWKSDYRSNTKAPVLRVEALSPYSHILPIPFRAFKPIYNTQFKEVPLGDITLNTVLRNGFSHSTFDKTKRSGSNWMSLLAIHIIDIDGKTQLYSPKEIMGTWAKDSHLSKVPAIAMQSSSRKGVRVFYLGEATVDRQRAADVLKYETEVIFGALDITGSDADDAFTRIAQYSAPLDAGITLEHLLEIVDYNDTVANKKNAILEAPGDKRYDSKAKRYLARVFNIASEDRLEPVAHATETPQILEVPLVAHKEHNRRDVTALGGELIELEVPQSPVFAHTPYLYKKTTYNLDDPSHYIQSEKLGLLSLVEIAGRAMVEGTVTKGKYYLNDKVKTGKPLSYMVKNDEGVLEQKLDKDLTLDNNLIELGGGPEAITRNTGIIHSREFNTLWNYDPYTQVLAGHTEGTAHATWLGYDKETVVPRLVMTVKVPYSIELADEDTVPVGTALTDSLYIRDGGLTQYITLPNHNLLANYGSLLGMPINRSIRLNPIAIKAILPDLYTVSSDDHKTFTLHPKYEGVKVKDIVELNTLGISRGYGSMIKQDVEQGMKMDPIPATLYSFLAMYLHATCEPLGDVQVKMGYDTEEWVKVGSIMEHRVPLPVYLRPDSESMGFTRPEEANLDRVREWYNIMGLNFEDLAKLTTANALYITPAGIRTAVLFFNWQSGLGKGKFRDALERLGISDPRANLDAITGRDLQRSNVDDLARTLIFFIDEAWRLSAKNLRSIIQSSSRYDDGFNLVRAYGSTSLIIHPPTVLMFSQSLPGLFDAPDTQITDRTFMIDRVTPKSYTLLCELPEGHKFKPPLDDTIMEAALYWLIYDAFEKYKTLYTRDTVLSKSDFQVFVDQARSHDRESIGFELLLKIWATATGSYIGKDLTILNEYDGEQAHPILKHVALKVVKSRDSNGKAVAVTKPMAYITKKRLLHEILTYEDWDGMAHSQLTQDHDPFKSIPSKVKTGGGISLLGIKGTKNVKAEMPLHQGPTRAEWNDLDFDEITELFVEAGMSDDKEDMAELAKVYAKLYFVDDIDEREEVAL